MCGEKNERPLTLRWSLACRSSRLIKFVCFPDERFSRKDEKWTLPLESFFYRRKRGSRFRGSAHSEDDWFECFHGRSPLEITNEIWSGNTMIESIQQLTARLADDGRNSPLTDRWSVRLSLLVRRSALRRVQFSELQSLLSPSLVIGDDCHDFYLNFSGHNQCQLVGRDIFAENLRRDHCLTISGIVSTSEINNGSHCQQITFASDRERSPLPANYPSNRARKCNRSLNGNGRRERERSVFLDIVRNNIRINHLNCSATRSNSLYSAGNHR